MNYKYSDRVTRILGYSKEEALRLNNDYIGPEHLMLGLIRDGESRAIEVLKKNFYVNIPNVKEALEHAVSLRARMEGDGKFLKEKLIGSLFVEEAVEEDAPNVIKQLATMGCSITARYFAVVDAAFSPIGAGQEAAAILAESSGGTLHTSPGRAGTRLLVLGNTAEDAEEQAYAFSASLVQELERSECSGIRVGIGEIVDRPEKITQSFTTARHIRHLLAERKEEQAVILGVREMGEMNNDSRIPSIIDEAKLYMAQNFTNPNLMLQDVAREVNMSKSRLSTLFSQQNGQTFTEYLLYLRLNKAKELLRSTNYKSTQIASETGYNDAHYFSYIFKKNIGMTPSEYRAQYQNPTE